MGFYILCEYCGEESKSYLACDCLQEQIKKKAIEWQTIWINSKVIDQKIVPKGTTVTLYFHLQKQDQDHYFSMYIDSYITDPHYEQQSHYKRLTKEEYLSKINEHE